MNIFPRAENYVRAGFGSQAKDWPTVIWWNKYGLLFNTVIPLIQCLRTTQGRVILCGVVEASVRGIRKVHGVIHEK